MSEFGFYLTFEVILYGLMVTKFLYGWNDLISNWRRVKFYWAHTLFSLQTFVTLMIRFKGRFISEDYENIGNVYEMIFHIILVPALLYFVIHQSFPQNIKSIDLKLFIKERRLHIFIPLSLFFLIAAIDIYFVTDYALGTWPIVLIFFAYLPVIFLRNLRYFEILTVVMALYLSYSMYIV